MSDRAVHNGTDIFGLLQCAGINRISLPPKTSQTSKRSKMFMAVILGYDRVEQSEE